MGARYSIKTEITKFVIELEDDILKSSILDLEGLYKIQPKSVTKKKNGYEIMTVGFMDVNSSEILYIYFEEAGVRCKGAIADYGRVEGALQKYFGQMPYEAMIDGMKDKKKIEIPDRTEEEITELVEQLLSKMTLKEKAGQMSQSTGIDVSEIGERLEYKSLMEQIRNSELGSLIYIGYSPENLYCFQKEVVEKSRLGIPLLFCQDVVHGFQSIFPIPLAQSSSFNMEIIQESAACAAREAATAGIMCAFAPMIDLMRDPRWGRVCEGAGEDPYLGGCFAEAIVKGYQGEKLSNSKTVAACLKHFVGYGACEGGRDYNTVEISDYTLHNMYLRSFDRGIKSGAEMVMSSFNVMNGVPVAGNKEILKDLLRDKMGFKGVTITDYAALKELRIHGCYDDNKTMVENAIKAASDIEMATSYYNVYLEELVKQGRVDESDIDNAVRRILTLKYKLGIMDDPYLYVQPELIKTEIYSEENLRLCEKLADESIVLLKNEDVLPIASDKKIALIGPCADSKDMLGAWQFSEHQKDCVTLKEGLEKRNIPFVYAKGCEIEESVPNGIEEALKAGKEADILVLALGESSSMTGEASSKQNITIPKPQVELIKAMKALNKPLVMVLTNGRPLLLEEIEADVDAILETWFLGSKAGDSIAKMLIGETSPSGKLTISFPRHTGQIPVYYNHYNTGRPYLQDGNNFTSKYIDGENAPFYSFGYGLTYSETECSEIQLSQAEMTENETIKATIYLKNIGKRDCAEVVQLYICDVAASSVRPVKELKGFKKIRLAKDEEQSVSFDITKDLLKYYNKNGDEVLETGAFDIWIGTSSRDCDLKKAKIQLN